MIEDQAHCHVLDHLKGMVWRGVLLYIQYSLCSVLTRRLDFVDILQQLLSLVDDIEGEIVHGQGLVSVVLQPLLGQRQVLRVEIIHLACQLLVP